ncbi:MAG: hypothetical protein HYT16_03600 [DPANN group archaeon]|nr:hypothetical protein [DPANN group archaeon]
MAAKIANFEKLVDVLITPAVIALAILIIGELFFGFEKYEPWVTIADAAIVFIFVFDLILKYKRVHDVKKFVKLYWLEILAVFPFYLIFRAFALFRDFGQGSEILQKTLHESVILKEGKELEVLAKEERLAGRLLRVGQRSVRIFAARLMHTHKRLIKAHHDIKNSQP